MRKEQTESQLLIRIRLLALFFIVALIISGATAFPLEQELSLITKLIKPLVESSRIINGLYLWIAHVHEAIVNTNASYPFLAYGTDWLAFAHIIIAIAFVGVLIKPVRNIWIVYWAILACAAVFPLAFICGSIREIPTFWILIDCSFGALGLIPLFFLIKYINELARISSCYVPTKY